MEPSVVWPQGKYHEDEARLAQRARSCPLGPRTSCSTSAGLPRASTMAAAKSLAMMSPSRTLTRPPTGTSSGLGAAGSPFTGNTWKRPTTGAWPRLVTITT